MNQATRRFKLQRDIYLRLQSTLKEAFGPKSEELEAYLCEYEQEFLRFGTVTSINELMAAVLSSRVTLCGDYHTLGQAQRTVVRILRKALPVLKQEKRELILFLEMVPASADIAARQYLDGTLEERQFLKKIRFKSQWGFRWENYRKIFDFARSAGISVLGLNGPGLGAGLRRRDSFGAERIAAALNEFPNALIFVLVGDSHLARNHLPLAIEKKIKKKSSLVSIHQNHEGTYWKMVERGVEESAEVIRLRKGSFCVMNTPPWIKLQSLVRWSQGPGVGRRADADPHLEWDFSEEFIELVEVISHFLGLDREPVDVNFELCSPKDTDLLERYQRELPPQTYQLLLAYLDAFGSLFVSYGKTVFLPDFNLNHAGSLAAQYLHCQLSDNHQIFENIERQFYSQLWIHALGFVGSKVINPKRKCNGPRDLKVLSEVPMRSKRRIEHHPQVVKWALSHLNWERGRGAPPRLPSSQKVETLVVFYAISKVLGQLLGEGLYKGVHQGKISQDALQAMFENPYEDPGLAKESYLDWAGTLDRLKLRSHAKGDRF